MSQADEGNGNGDEASAGDNESPVEGEEENNISEKLDEHRCAICQNVMINVCRIDCGHKFCRHCLNMDMARRVRGEKPTCFICDAAITEISKNNSEEDKEIDKLYDSLSTEERLSRARAKSVRKEEEAAFVNSPKGEWSESEQSSWERSSGSGDASLHNRSDESIASEQGDGIGANESEFCAAYTIFHDDPDDIDYSSPDDFQFEENIEAFHDFEAASQPMVIHHTVEHVYHAVEVRNGAPTGRVTEESGYHQHQQHYMPFQERREFCSDRGFHEGHPPCHVFRAAPVGVYGTSFSSPGVGMYNSHGGMCSCMPQPTPMCHPHSFMSCHLMENEAHSGGYLRSRQNFRPWSDTRLRHDTRQFPPFRMERNTGQGYGNGETDFDYGCQMEPGRFFNYETGEFPWRHDNGRPLTHESYSDALERSSYETLSSLAASTRRSDEITSITLEELEDVRDEQQDDEPLVTFSVSLGRSSPEEYRRTGCVNVTSSHGLLDFRACLSGNRPCNN